MEHFLLAIIPSEDIVIKIRDLRKSVFKNLGLISSLCLPVMIPVAFLEESINKDLFSDIQLTTPLTTSNDILIEEQNIFLGIKNIDIIEKIVESLNLSIKKGFISTGRGFYLGTNENNLNSEEILTYLAHNSEKILVWRKNNLKLIKIITENEIWWENIRWETIWNQKIKLKNNYFL